MAVCPRCPARTPGNYLAPLIPRLGACRAPPSFMFLSLSHSKLCTFPGGELSQRELIAMAFAGDDVAADFAAQKAEEAEEEAPPAEAATMLPGWGSWASAKRMQRDADAAAKKAQQ